MIRYLLPVSILSIFLLAGCGEDGRFGITFINQGEHVVESGQVLFGDIAIAGGQVHIEDGSRITGSVYVLGGDVTLDSRVDGDVAALGGQVLLDDSATIGGDLITAGSELTRSANATVEGQVVTIGEAGTGVSPVGRTTTIGARLISILFVTGVMSLLAGLLVRAMPTLTARVADAAVEFPLMSGALGLLVLIVLPMLLVFMAFTIVLIPFSLAGVLLLGLVTFFGLVGLGRGIGRRLASRFGWSVSITVATLSGTAILIVFGGIASLIPIVAEITLALLTALALGAVLLSGFGTREYEPPSFPESKLQEYSGSQELSGKRSAP